MLAILNREPEGNKGQEPQFVIDEREEGAAESGQLAVLCNAEFEAGSRWSERPWTLGREPQGPWENLCNTSCWGLRLWIPNKHPGGQKHALSSETG